MRRQRAKYAISHKLREQIYIISYKRIPETDSSSGTETTHPTIGSLMSLHKMDNFIFQILDTKTL